MIRLAAALALAASVAGCKSNKPSPDPAPSAVAEAASSSAGAAASAAAPSASASASVAAAAAPVPTELHLFATSDVGGLAVLPTAKGALIAAIEPFSEDPPAVVVEGDVATPVRGLFNGIGRQDEDYKLGNHVRELFGRYPDRFYARVDQVGGRSGSESFFYASKAGAWKQDIGPDPGDPTFVGDKIAAIKLMFVQPVVVGIFGVDATFPDVNEQDENCPGGRYLNQSPTVVTGTPSGELYLLSYKCGEDHERGGPVIDIWPKATGRSSKTTPIHEVIARPSLVAARSATEAYVAGADDEDKWYVAKFDGTSWKRDPEPTPALLQIVTTADGTLWMLAEDGVIRRGPDGKRTTLALPEAAKGGSLERISAPSGTEVWASGGGFVVSTRKPKEVLKIDPTSLAPKGATADCKTVFVQLYAITKMTPAGFDFPKTRDAMKGHKELAGVRFVVTKDDRFGAIVRSLDEGKAVQKIAQAGVRGSRPQLLCMKPDESREVKFDLESGKTK